MANVLVGSPDHIRYLCELLRESMAASVRTREFDGVGIA